MSIGRYRNPVGGASNFGAAYEGDYFYLDYYVGAIRRLKYNGVSWIDARRRSPDSRTRTTGRPASRRSPTRSTDTDGAIYYVRQFAPGFAGPGSLGRIRANPNAPQLTIDLGQQPDGEPGPDAPEPARRAHDDDRRHSDRRPER